MKYPKRYIFSENSKYAESLPSDLLLDVDISESYYRAGQLIEKVYEKYIERYEAEQLNRVMVDDRAHFDIKKRILFALGRMMYSFLLAEKFIKKYNIKEEIDYIPQAFSYSLYQLVSQEKNFVLQNVNIPDWYLNKMRWQELLNNSASRLKLLLYPIYISFCMKMRMPVNETKKYYAYGIHVWDSWLSAVSDPCRMDFLEGNGKINTRNSIYIVDGYISGVNIEKVKKNGFDVCILQEMIQTYSWWKYMSEVCPEILKMAYKLFKKTNHKQLLSEAYLRTLQIYLSWEIFYSKYAVNTFLAIQEPGNIPRVICQNKHGSKSLFILWSTIGDRLSRKNMNTHTDSNYGYMVYDAMLSSKLSNDYCRKNNNVIGEYVDCGIFFSDRIFRIKHDVSLSVKLKQDLNIPKDKVIIGFFDTTMGRNASLSIEQGEKILNDIYRLLQSDEKYFLIYRLRSFSRIQGIPDLESKVARLISHDRVCNINKLMPQYFAYHVMGICDLVIGIFASSALFEAVAGGIPTICYLPSERFYDNNIIVNQIPRFCVQNYEQLKACTQYWLNIGEYDFHKFQDNYIKKYIDSYCDGQSLERLYATIEKYSNQGTKTIKAIDDKKKFYFENVR